MIINEKHDGLTVEDDDIFIEKLLDDVDSSVITVWFTIESQRNDSIRVRLTDPLPEGWSPERVGFHPNHEPEHWDFEDGSMVFEREFEPEEEHTTIYALRVEDSSDIETFKSIPRFDIWPPGEEQPSSMKTPPTEEPVAATNGPAGGYASDSALDMDVHPDDPDWVKEMKQNADDDTVMASSQDDDETQPSDNLDQTVEGDGGRSVSMVGEGAALAYEQEQTNVDTSSKADETNQPIMHGEALLDTFLDALQSDASTDDREAIREALGINGYKGLSARVDYLNKQHGELAAYTDALREFIDEEGTGVEIVETLREQRDQLQAEMESIHGRLDDVLEQQALHNEEFERTQGLEERVETRFNELTVEINDILSQIDQLESDHIERIEELTSSIESVDAEHTERLDTVKKNIEEVNNKHEQRLTELQTTLEDFMEAFETSLEQQIEDLETEVSAVVDQTKEKMEEDIGEIESNLSAKVDRLDSELTDSVGALEEELDEVDEDLDELEEDLDSVLEWRSAVVRMFTQD